MSNENEVKAGAVAIVKVGRNEVPVMVIEKIASGYRVRSRESGKEFPVRQFARIVLPAPAEPPGEPVTENGSNHPATSAPETKKRSLLDAAIEVLKTDNCPLNTRDLVKAAVERGLWQPTGCKTPEQTLYGSIFREIATKEFPRVRKSTQKGKFELTR